MKPPRSIEFGVAAAGDPLDSLLSAFNSGRLVALLRGEGLTRTTVEELLTPESAAKLQTLLTERVFSVRADRANGLSSQPDSFRPDDGKVLVFRSKEAFKP